MRAPIQGNLAPAIRIASKTGFLTKKVWVEFLDEGATHWENRSAQNRRFKKLLDSGLFKMAPDTEIVRPILTLSPAGIRYAVDLGLDPVFTPPLKNLIHDEELTRLALFLEAQGWVSQWMTEQELKVNQNAQRFFKNEVRAQKFPDLLIQWKTPKDKIIWAIELERTRKEFTRYYEMVGAYKGISRVDLVFVIAATGSIETNITKAKSKMDYPDKERPMLFASMNQVIENPFGCELRSGTKRITLGKMGHLITGVEAKKTLTEVKKQCPGDDTAWVNKKLENKLPKMKLTTENKTGSCQPPPPPASPESPVTTLPQRVV